MKEGTIECKNMNKIRVVAKDIITTKFLIKSEVIRINNRFYKIMRKHGICEGTRTKNRTGRLCNNFEWTISRELFLNQVKDKLDVGASLLALGIPEDLLSYKVSEVLND